MTILFLSRLFYPHIGGVEKHVLEVGKRLVEMGHKVIVITEKYQSEGEGAKVMGEIDGIEIHRIDFGEKILPFDWFRVKFKKFQIWWWLWQHKELIEKADIVHCHDVFFWYLPFRFLFSKKPVYTTFHGYEGNNLPSKKAIFMHKLAEKLSNGNICVGDYIKKWYRTTSDYVTYGGVDVHLGGAEVVASSPSEVLKGQAKLRILFIGRLEKDTGVHIYLKVLDILKQKEIKFKFEACGDGTLRRIVMKYGKVYGFVKDVSKYIDRSDFVFTSSYLSIFEAISRGKIVFSVFENKLKEDYLKLSPFAKWIIIKKSPQETVRKIVYYLNHQKEMEIITTTARKWVKDQTWERVLAVCVALWGHKIP